MGFETSYILNKDLPVQLAGKNVNDAGLNVVDRTSKTPFHPRFVGVFTYAEYKYPLALSMDGLTGYSSQGPWLIKSTDDWVTTSTVFADFPTSVKGVSELENGKLLVSLEPYEVVADIVGD